METNEDNKKIESLREQDLADQARAEALASADHRRDGRYGLGEATEQELLHLGQSARLDVRIEPLADPSLAGQLSPYAASALRSITSSQINPYAVDLYGSQGTYMSESSDAIITGVHPDLPVWLKYLGGGDSEWTCQQRPIEQLPLSRVLPRVVMTGAPHPWPIPQGSYWIDYANFSRHRTRIPDDGWAMNVRERFPTGSQLVLGPIMDHHVRIAMWNLRYKLWESDFIKQFDAVVCPDFSSYINDPAPQSLLGERMTQIWTEMAMRHGINVIPIISWSNEDSLARQADRLGALAEAGLVHTVYIEWLARGVKKDHWIHHRVEAFERHLAHLPIRWIFSGIESGRVMARIHKALPAGNFHTVGIWSWKRTQFEPGLTEQRARVFRGKLAQIERHQRGEELPPSLARPNPLTSGLDMPKLGDKRGI